MRRVARQQRGQDMQPGEERVLATPHRGTTALREGGRADKLLGWLSTRREGMALHRREGTWPGV